MGGEHDVRGLAVDDRHGAFIVARAGHLSRVAQTGPEQRQPCLRCSSGLLVSGRGVTRARWPERGACAFCKFVVWRATCRALGEPARGLSGVGVSCDGFGLGCCWADPPICRAKDADKAGRGRAREGEAVDAAPERFHTVAADAYRRVRRRRTNNGKELPMLATISVAAVYAINAVPRGLRCCANGTLPI